MFEEFYEMYEPEEQEVVALINRCIGGGFNWKGNFWEMTVVTLGIMFCDTGKVSTKEERLDWPVTEEERNSDKGWGRFGKEQICRLKIRRMKEERAKDLVVRPWCTQPGKEPDHGKLLLRRVPVPKSGFADSPGSGAGTKGTGRSGETLE